MEVNHLACWYVYHVLFDIVLLMCPGFGDRHRGQWKATVASIAGHSFSGVALLEGHVELLAWLPLESLSF